MTNRFPIVLDTSDGNRLKELPAGDNLDLQGSGIKNAQTIEVASLETGTLTVNNTSFSAVAFSGSYDDLTDTPTLFNKDYNALSNKPFIPSVIGDLANVAAHTPNDGQVVVWKASENRFTFEDKFTEIDLADFNLGDIGDVVFSGPVTDKFIKFYAGGWRESSITWTDVINKPTNVSYLVNDAEYVTQQDLESGIEITPTGDLTGSVFSDDSTMLIDAVAGKVVGNVDTSLIENTSGNLTVNADNYVVIDSTNNGQIEIGRFSGLGDVILGNTSNSTDVQIDGRLFIRGGGVPATSVGLDGDFEGIFAVDNNYIYYCTASFDGVTDIWRRTPWAESSW